jgi:hypothetical protein
MMEVAMKKSIKMDWRSFINGLDVRFPEKGAEAPDSEMLEEGEDIIGNLTRLTLDIFIFDNDEIENAFMMQNEKMRIYQDISLKDSMALVARNKKKKG